MHRFRTPYLVNFNYLLKLWIKPTHLINSSHPIKPYRPIIHPVWSSIQSDHPSSLINHPSGPIIHPVQSFIPSHHSSRPIIHPVQTSILSKHPSHLFIQYSPPVQSSPPSDQSKLNLATPQLRKISSQKSCNRTLIWFGLGELICLDQ